MAAVDERVLAEHVLDRAAQGLQSPHMRLTTDANRGRAGRPANRNHSRPPSRAHDPVNHDRPLDNESSI